MSLPRLKQCFFRELPEAKADAPSIVDQAQPVPQSHEEQIVSYLLRGKLTSMLLGVYSDVLSKKGEKLPPPQGIRSDGVWEWDAGLHYYVKRYHVRVPEEFVAHMQAHGWEPPVRDEVIAQTQTQAEGMAEEPEDVPLADTPGGRVLEAVGEERQRPVQRWPPEPDARLSGRKVLIADADVRNAFALAMLLEGKGMNVVAATSGEDALEVLRAQPDVELVLMEVELPEIDGYELMRTLHGDPRFEHLPIIALTTPRGENDREKCLAAGASDFLTRPVDLGQLCETLRRWFR